MLYKHLGNVINRLCGELYNVSEITSIFQSTYRFILSRKVRIALGYSDYGVWKFQTSNQVSTNILGI